MSNESIPKAESTELEAGAAIATTEQQPQDQKETQTETLAEAPKDPFAAGRQRMDSIAQSVSGAKEKAATKIKNLGSKFSSFFGRTKKVVGEGAMTSVAAVLSAPEIAKKADAAMGQFAEQSGQVIGQKIAEAGSKASELAEQSAEYVGQKITQVGEKAGQFAEQSAEFVGQKVAQGAEWAQDKAEIAAFMTAAAVDKTKEGFATARDAVKGKLEQASESVKRELAEQKKAYKEAKSSFWNKVNNYRMAKLQEKIEKLDAKKQQAMAEISLLSRLGDVEIFEPLSQDSPLSSAFADRMEQAA